jgi:hypothetical protein
VLVIPNLICWTGAIEEEDIGGNAGIRGENSVRQPNNSVEIELLEQFLLDAGADAVAE